MEIDPQLGLAAMLATILAAIAWFAERRRLRRSNLDRVGWVPWTTLFFFALFAAVILLALALKTGVAG